MEVSVQSNIHLIRILDKGKKKMGKGTNLKGEFILKIT